MPAKFVCSSHFATIWLLLLLPLGCDSDDELVKDNQVVDGAPVLISTIPINGGILSSYGTVFMNFSKPPGIVTVNGTLAIANGRGAFWNAGGLTSGQTVVLLLTYSHTLKGLGIVPRSFKESNCGINNTCTPMFVRF